MNNTELLKSAITLCDINSERLKGALQRLSNLMPFNTKVLDKMSIEELGVLELLKSRFAKLQDLIGNKVFTLLLIQIGEDQPNFTFIDRLNILEKLEILPSKKDWMDMRDLRNHIVHEYPDNPELMIKNLNQATVYAKHLVTYWETLRVKIISLI